jgi:hypothetical protein
VSLHFSFLRIEKAGAAIIAGRNDSGNFCKNAFKINSLFERQSAQNRKEAIDVGSISAGHGLGVATLRAGRR